MSHVKSCPCPACVATRGIQIPAGYEQLAAVLARAMDQAARGKGKERHATDGVPFHEQDIVTEGAELGNVGFQIGQARKKSKESLRLPTVERQVTELLGAINYLAAAVIVLEKK